MLSNAPAKACAGDKCSPAKGTLGKANVDGSLYVGRATAAFVYKPELVTLYLRTSMKAIETGTAALCHTRGAIASRSS